MSDRILEIVMFLMDYMRSHQNRLADTDDFSLTLRNMGYTDNEISSAYFWLLNRFDSAPEELFADFPLVSQSTRVLTEFERQRITTGAHGLLLKLINLGLIDDEDLETILERVAIFSADPVDEEEIKMVASSIVFGDIDEYSDYDLIGGGAGSPRVN
ncbi:MAG: DUF494 family protein [bacterium]